MTHSQEKRQTISSYEKTAEYHSKKFDQSGVRKDDIRRAFSYINKKNAKVVELGCGNGRDAGEILKYTNNYLGIDLSANLLNIARRKAPRGRYLLADLESYVFPEAIDVIFAFASLLHSNIGSVTKVLSRVYGALSAGGVFFISLKYGQYHKKVIFKEREGLKVYYFYTPEDIIRVAPTEFSVVYQNVQERQGQEWFEILLQKDK